MTIAIDLWRPNWALAVMTLWLSAACVAAASAVGPPGGWLGTVTVVFAPVALVAGLVRPHLAAAVLAGLVVANAGLVLGESAGVTNVVRLGSILAIGGLLLAPGYRRTALRWTPVLAAFLLFAEIRGLSALAAPDGAAVGGTAKSLVFGGLLVLVFSALGHSALALRRATEVTVAVAALLAGLSLLRLSGIGGSFGGFAADVALTAEERQAAVRSLLPQGDVDRVAGPLRDPNFWAQALVLVLPLALWLARTGASRGARFAAGASAGAIAAGVFLTQSRGGAIALLVAVVVWFFLQGGRLRSLLPVLVPAVVVAVVALPGTAERTRSLPGLANPAQAEDRALRGRYSEAVAALQMLRDHPLRGVGAGEYRTHYRAYAMRIGIDARPEREAHSSYLQMAAESGLPGLLAFCGMLAATFWAGLRARSLLRRRDPVSAGGAEALVAGLAGYAVAALFLHQAFPDYLWLAMGLTAGYLLLAREPQQAAAAEEVYSLGGSHVFHRGSCGRIRAVSTRLVWGSRDDARAAGLRACKVCRP